MRERKKERNWGRRKKRGKEKRRKRKRNKFANVPLMR